MTEEEKKAIKSMKRFVECRQDMTAVTASEMKIVLNLLEKKDKESHFIQSELDIANAKIIELNKIIDLMAKYIGKTDDETFCDEDKYERDIEDNVIGCDEDCQECVKQYFERKVENGN